MVSRVYPKSMWKFLVDEMSWADLPWKVIACSGEYTYSSSHEFVSDLGGAIVARSGPLEDKRIDFDLVAGETHLGARAALLEQYIAGTTAVGMVLYCDTGEDASSRILGYWELGGGRRPRW